MSSLSLAFPMTTFLLFIFPFTACAHSHQDDQKSLLAFKQLITSDPNNSIATWTPAVPLCNWTSVTCSRRHSLRAVGLNLSGMGLGGPISPFLGNLSFLRTLDLSDNVLHGHIPTQLGRLFRLRTLILADNSLEGNIPGQLSSCRDLSLLELSHNNLNGYIPRQLGSLTHLQGLYLDRNNLIGVESTEADFQNKKCIVRGRVDPKALVDHIHKKACKHAQVIPQKKLEKENDNIHENKGDGDGDGNKADGGASSVPRYVMQNCSPPQLFNDENPNAYFVM